MWRRAVRAWSAGVRADPPADQRVFRHAPGRLRLVYDGDDRLLAAIELRRDEPFRLLASPSELALDRHYAAHPKHRGANVAIFKLCDEEELADEG